MPITVVVGGQFGSEGKGKVALHAAREVRTEYVVRVGGTNSGHTGVDSSGRTIALRQLPASLLAPRTVAVLPPGAIVDPDILLQEVRLLGLNSERIVVSPFATVITQADKDREQEWGIVGSIGSTGSGSGAALARRVSRQDGMPLAGDVDSLKPFLRSDTTKMMRDALDRKARIVIEGSQGFGLSMLNGGEYPHATSRDTTAATFVGEAGLSPIDVDEIVLVIRSHPIRVAGNSGRLAGETTWSVIAEQARLPLDYREMTTATRKVRRVGSFDGDLVRRAIAANRPTSVVLNHFDYVDPDVREGQVSVKGLAFLSKVDALIGRRVDRIGIGPDGLVDRNDLGGQLTSKYRRQSD